MDSQKKDNSIAGFFLNALYSPFFTLTDIVKDFIESKDTPHKLQATNSKIYSKDFVELVFSYPYTKIDLSLKSLALLVKQHQNILRFVKKLAYLSA